MNLSSFYNPAMGITSDDDVKRIVNMRSGNARIRFRYLVLDQNLQPVQLTAPPNPAIPNDMADHVTTCTVNVTNSGDIARSMTIAMDELPGFQLNPNLHRIRVACSFVDEQEREYFAAPVPLGTFRAFTPDRDITGPLTLENATWQCITGTISDRPFIHEYSVPEDTRVADILRALLMADDRPASWGGRTVGGGYPDANAAAVTPAQCFYSGPSIPASRLQLEDSPVTTVGVTAWTNKDNVTSALAQMADTGLYWPWWGDANGTVVLKQNPYQHVTTSGSFVIPTAEWIYYSGDTDGIIEESISVKYPNIAKVKNYVAVVVDNASRDTLFAEAKNDSADSLISILYREVNPQVIVLDSLPDLATAQAYANVMLMRASMTEQQITFTTGSIVPFVDLHSLIGFDISLNGVQEIRTDYPYEVTNISIDCVNRTQSVTCQRVIGL